MEKLLQPDLGLIFWTIVNFALLAFLLAKFAWKPLISAIEAREKKINDDIIAAQNAKDEAKQIEANLKREMENSSKKAAAVLEEATKAAQKEREQILQDAQNQAQNLVTRAKEEINLEAQKALNEVKEELVNTALLAAQKIVAKESTVKTNTEMVEELLEEINENR